MKQVVVWSTVLLTLAACSATKGSYSSGTPSESTRAQFEALQSLAGEWDGTAAMGGQPNPTHVSYKLTGAGSTVVETLFPKDEHEMITTYHLDGSRLVMTHYCSAGNQPTMVAKSWSKTPSGGTKIEWEFVSATNLPSTDQMHMHALTQVIDGKDKLQETWTSWQDGKPAHTAMFDLHRVPTAVR